MVKEIITDFDKLSMTSEEIDVRKENKLVQFITRCLIDTVKAKNLKGLSAIQIGFNKRIFAINFNGNIKVMLNPGITNCKEQTFSRETCSSIPDKQFIVPRYASCDVAYMEPDGNPQVRQLKGAASFVYQHYLDHLEGILLSDFGLEIDEDFDKASDEEKEELLNWYAENIGRKKELADKELNDDPEMKQLADAVKFLEAKNRGEIEFDGVMNGEQL